VVKFWPHKQTTRAPTPKEIKQSLPYLQEELSWHPNAFITALGKTAAKALGIKGNMANIAGHLTDGIFVMYHPAAVLRGTVPKRVWLAGWEAWRAWVNDDEVIWPEAPILSVPVIDTETDGLYGRLVLTVRLENGIMEVIVCLV
jgi:uracil-DNA glycosylase